jgi:hypothetical protein
MAACVRHGQDKARLVGSIQSSEIKESFMELVSVIAAALAAYAFGAVWYMMMAKPWMAAAGLTADTINRSDKKPYIISLICAVIVAGMMRHVLGMTGIENPAKGTLVGLGLGAFIAAPWIFTNNGFAGRPMRLSLIDSGYFVGGSGIMGLILTVL